MNLRDNCTQSSRYGVVDKSLALYPGVSPWFYFFAFPVGCMRLGWTSFFSTITYVLGV